MNELNIDMRNIDKKTHRILSNGNVPGVVYGPAMNSVPVKMKHTELMKALQGLGEVYEVDFHGNKFMAKVNEVQTHPVSRELIHFSLVQLEKDERSDVEVPIKFKGEPIGIKKGGVMVVLKDELPVNGKPSQIPEKLTANVANLDIGDKITTDDLKIPKNVEVDIEEKEVIAVCNPPVKPEEVLSEESLKNESKFTKDEISTLGIRAV